MQVEPEVIFISNQFTDNPYLKCCYGWNDETTKAFIESDFKELILSGGKGQEFLIPDLGNQAKKISQLRIGVHQGVVQGIEQFSENIHDLGISHVPKNSIDISIFKNLSSLGVTWDKKIEQQVNNITGVDSLSLGGYKPTDLSNLKCITTIKKLNTLQGNLVSLKGVNPDLVELSVVRARNYSDVETINTLHNLRWLHCEYINKAQGIVKLGGMNNLTFVNFVDTGCTLDFKDLGKLQNLEKLWTNGEHINLNWEELIPLPKLKVVGLFDSDVTDEQITSIAKRANKKIEKLFRAGTKKKPHIQITFED